MLIVGKQKGIINRDRVLFSPEILYWQGKTVLAFKYLLEIVVDSLIRSTERKKRAKVCAKQVLK